MKRERGFALLLVFVMAAAVAIMLYNQLPRVAFEAQRNKEQLLIERGEQYSRAIQLFVRKIKRYPATIEELEGTNSVRFLRKRYDDPMTGKSEWRLVHVGAGGVFLDSLVHKPPTAKAEEKAVNTFTYEAPSIGSTVPTGQEQPGFPQLRPSERMGIRPPGQQGQPVDPLNPPQNTTNSNLPPGSVPPAPPGIPTVPAGIGLPPGALGTLPPGSPGLPPGVVPPGGAYTQQGANPQQPGFNPQQPGQPLPYGVPQPGGYPGQPVNSQTGGVAQYPYSTQPGAQGAPTAIGQPGTVPIPGQPPGQNEAVRMIDQILRTPRATQPNAAQPQGVTQIGGGIAGIASTVERTGIKIYKEMEKYNEWEFLYDLTQDKTGLGAQIPQQQPGQQQPGQQTGQPPLGQQPTGQQPSPFGQQPPPFGQQPPPFGQQPQPYGQQPFGTQPPPLRPRR